jgi:hypothetical protein
MKKSPRGFPAGSNLGLKRPDMAPQRRDQLFCVDVWQRIAISHEYTVHVNRFLVVFCHYAKLNCALLQEHEGRLNEVDQVGRQKRSSSRHVSPLIVQMELVGECRKFH